MREEIAFQPGQVAAAPAAHVSPAHGPLPRAIVGALSFESPEAQVQHTAELLGWGAIVACVGAATPSLRGRLGERIDDVIERELGARGAPSPYLAEWSTMPDDAEGRLSDQLFRARTVGATGIAILLGSLVEITSRGALGTEDSAALRALMAMTREAGVVLMIDDGDRALLVQQAPVSLASLIDEEPSACAAEMVETVVEAPVALRVAAPEEPAPEHEQEETEEPAAVMADAVATEVAIEEEHESAAEKHARAIVAGVPVAGKNDTWRRWAIALSAARGPQPLAAFERLFVESYLPLSAAISAGLDDPRALRAETEFRAGFERSYTDAFVTFGATGRRPKLVMDAFDVASQKARLHHARTSQVLVVDALRYDLGALVRDDLAARGGGALSLAGESLLWSALPTTTFRQLETLARGVDALRAPSPDESADSLRGRTAENVRRMRVGSREIYKLDLVPALLEQEDAASAQGIIDALPRIAEHVGDAILRHATTLAPRTLLLVIGDHGFSIDRRGRIEDGGASPEEVLVPCFAYLVGEVH